MFLTKDKPLSTLVMENLKAYRNNTFNYLNVPNSFFWLQSMSNIYPKLSQNFKSLFISKGKMDKPNIIIGLGNFLDIQILASNAELRTNVYIKNELVSKEKEFLISETMPYRSIFKILSSKMKEIQSHVPKEFLDIPLLGGWTCDAISEDLQEVAKFTLPEIVVMGQESEYDVMSFVGDVVFPSAENVQDLQEKQNLNYQGSIAYVPEKEIYQSNLNYVLDKIESGDLSKVVISRKAVIDFSAKQDAIPLIAKVSEQNHQEYSYYFCWNEGEQWFGVSPEVLLIKEKEKIVTKPLAGTRKISYGQKTEEEIIEELLLDSKEDLEHRYAINLMIEDLKELSVDKEVQINEDKCILKTPYAYHIKSNIHAYVDAEVTSFDVMACMYPPATIWGIPREEVEQILTRVEPFKRKFFAGGLGYCRVNDDSNFALAIRTACLNDGKLNIFAGSGIVKNAVPENEWSETQTKMIPFLGAIETTI